MRRKKLLQAVEQGTAAALEKSQSALNEAAERLAPLLEQAREHVVPLAEEAAVKLRPVLQQGVRVAADTLDRVQPAIDRVGPAVNATVKKVQSGVDELRAATPALSAAAQDTLAKLADFADHAAEPEPEPIVLPPVPVKRKKSWKRRLGVLALVAAAIGGIAVALKKVVAAPAEPDWITHTPSDSYIAHPAAEVTEDFVPSAEVLTVPEDGEVVASETPELPEEPEAAAVEISLESAVSTDSAVSTADEGGYVGDEPPAGFIIKGNSRSKKYHQPGQSRYEITNADVWFDSTEAAEAAGFQPAKS
ncbi:MAG: hypothetical protein LBK28_01860 [Propionibacteriaceae bacterium]|jgi:hypothetical protein|nr:hypothetical protein [Propionibacteriaceae bacterium]